MMAIFMPTDFKSLSLNNLLKLQQQQQLQNPSNIFANESLFKPYFNNQTASNAIMTETNNSDSAKNNSNRLCSEDDSNSNDSELSVGQEKVQQEKNSNIKESPHSEDDEMSNASSSQYTNSSTRLCSPQEIMRPTMQFHEEILRSSQLYAEELLRQRIAAAARLQSSVTDVKCSPDEPEPSIISKLSFQSSLFNRAAVAASSTDNENGNNLFCAKSAINFQNIHSHLSSIAQITHSLGSSGSGSNHHMKKDDASLSSLSRESSQSPSGFQQFKLQQHNHLHHHNQQQKHGFHTSTHQNQLNEHNLKFSIDNILKADFGRRITEPLLKSSKAKRALRDGKHEKDKVNMYKSNSNNKINNNSSSSSAEGQQTTNDKSMDQTFSSDNASKNSGASSTATKTDSSGQVWPAWVFCTRYSDRPSSGRSPRVKKPKKPPSETGSVGKATTDDEKRPRTAFSGSQLARLKHEFNENRYLTEKRRQQLSGELGLNEAQIKIWFQNKRAKIKKSSGVKNPLALQLMAQGLYNHSTIPLSKEEEELQELQAGGGN